MLCFATPKNQCEIPIGFVYSTVDLLGFGVTQPNCIKEKTKGGLVSSLAPIYPIYPYKWPPKWIHLTIPTHGFRDFFLGGVNISKSDPCLPKNPGKWSHWGMGLGGDSEWQHICFSPKNHGKNSDSSYWGSNFSSWSSLFQPLKGSRKKSFQNTADLSNEKKNGYTFPWNTGGLIWILIIGEL